MAQSSVAFPFALASKPTAGYQDNDADLMNVLGFAKLCLDDAHEFGVEDVVPRTDAEFAMANQLFEEISTACVMVDSALAQTIVQQHDGIDDEKEEESTLSIMSHSEPIVEELQRLRDVLRHMLPSHAGYMCLCCVCREHELSVFQAPCGHDYCAPCLRKLALAAIADISLLPLRCCTKHFDLEILERTGILSEEEFEALHDRCIELTTAKPLYCCEKACSAFIRPDLIVSDVVECPECSKKVCVSCCEEAHAADADCPLTLKQNEVLEMAESVGWKQCFNCNRMVELIHGCNHMTCLCGAEFCYECGQRWKQCGCEQWDEANLFATAERRVRVRVAVDDDDDGWGNAAIARAEVDEMAEFLREHHECDHRGRWRRCEIYNGRRGRCCEVCQRRVFKYLLQCRHCMLTACQECRGHRI